MRWQISPVPCPPPSTGALRALGQVEEVVAGTNTGMSTSFAGYYHYWEKCIFNAITKCIISSMATFLALLQSKDRPPLCEVKANLNGKDLVVTPTVNDIYKYLTKSVKNIVESARMFVRWMHGTCCQTAPQVNNTPISLFVVVY